MTDEAATRKTLIDAVLRLVGRNLADCGKVAEENEIELVAIGAAPRLATGVHAGPFVGRQFEHCVLLVRGRVAAVVEAKRTANDARLGQEQALHGNVA